MDNNKLKDIVEYYVDDEETLDKIVVLEGDEFADGCVGITEDHRLVYDYYKTAESITKHDDISIDEAIEWIEYNTLRSLPYMESDGLLAPVFMYTFDKGGVSMRFIECEERLPKKPGRYLVIVKTKNSDKPVIDILKFSLDLYQVDKYDFQEYKGKKHAGWYSYDGEYGYSEFDMKEVLAWTKMPRIPDEYWED